MELQELQERWQAQEQRLQEHQQQTLLLTRELRATQTSSALRKLLFSLWIELWMDLAMLLLLGSYLWVVLLQPRYSVPALILMVFLGGGLVLLIMQLQLLHRLDYGASVVALQKELARLGLLRSTEVKWVLLLSPLLWPPLLLVFLHGVLGLDPFVVLNKAWLIANVIFGVVMSALLWWMARYLSARYREAPWLQWLRRNIAGEEINAAGKVLARYAAFERE